MEIKPSNPKLKQSGIVKKLILSSFTIQRYSREIKLLSPHRLLPSSKTNHTKKQKTPNTIRDDVKVTSNDLKVTSNESVKPRKNKLKGGANIEFTEKNLDKIIHIIYL